MKIKNIKTLKAALLGVVFISTGIFLLVKGITTDYSIIFGLLIGGTALCFIPDTVIGKLEKTIIGKEIKLFKQNDSE